VKRLAWATDIHLNFVSDADVEAFSRSIVALSPDAVALGGDIGDADSVLRYLAILDSILTCPVYVVPGNHDYYGGSIREVQQHVAAYCAQSLHLCWLPAAGVVPLSDDTALIGHGGWADARYGTYARSGVRLNDYRRITELTGLTHDERRRVLERLGDEAAAYVAEVLPQALASVSHVVLLTHVPPFREACWHEGQVSDDTYLPHFACKAMGDVLLATMSEHPDRKLTVLCGHTHSGGIAHPRPNITVLTGTSTYGKPTLQMILDVE